MKPVRFLESAREEVRREKSYYRKISPDLSIQFQNALEIAVNAVAMQPLDNSNAVFAVLGRYVPLSFIRTNRYESQFLLIGAGYQKCDK